MFGNRMVGKIKPPYLATLPTLKERRPVEQANAWPHDAKRGEVIRVDNLGRWSSNKSSHIAFREVEAKTEKRNGDTYGTWS